MNKFTIIGCASLVALVLAGFGPNPWRASADPTPQASIAPFELTLASHFVPVAAVADTF